MFLAFKMSDVITIPFGYLLDWLYVFTHNYGAALILFSVLVQLVMLPITAKQKKSMMKMSRLTPRLQEIQKRYADDQQKQSQAMQELYRSEGVSMTGGCLWSFIPLLILIPLYSVVRQPILYMLHQTPEVAQQIIEIIRAAEPTLFPAKNNFYDEMIAAAHIQEYAAVIKEALPALSERVLEGINFSFLGFDLGPVPVFNVFGAAWSWDWPHIGAFLVPFQTPALRSLQGWHRHEGTPGPQTRPLPRLRFPHRRCGRGQHSPPHCPESGPHGIRDSSVPSLFQ